ncbi:MAG: hypothetical protein WC496_05510 [Phycisphaerae bacterium]
MKKQTTFILIGLFTIEILCTTTLGCTPPPSPIHCFIWKSGRWEWKCQVDQYGHSIQECCEGETPAEDECCAWDKICCNHECVTPDGNQACCDGEELYNTDTQECCGGNVITKCDPDECESCIDGECKVCGGDPNKQCCGNYQCCNESCNDSFNCEKCKDGGGCQACLRTVSTYEELESCSKVDNPDRSPTANGCSAPLENGDNPAGCTYSSFLSSCNTHDLCYGNCSRGKSECDSTFNNEMETVCTSLDNVSDGCYYPCNSWRNVYYMAVLGLGDLFYKPAQVTECACNDC